MPLYEYKCPKCGDFEEIQSVNDAELEVCPVCGEKVKKIMSLSADPVFKGTGFYTTDYKKRKQRTD